jgi:hypothetical protein
MRCARNKSTTLHKKHKLFFFFFLFFFFYRLMAETPADWERLVASLQAPCATLAATLRDDAAASATVGETRLRCLEAIRLTCAHIAAAVALGVLSPPPAVRTAAAQATRLCLGPVLACAGPGPAACPVTQAARIEAARCAAVIVDGIWDGAEKATFSITWREVTDVLVLAPTRAGKGCVFFFFVRGVKCNFLKKKKKNCKHTHTHTHTHTLFNHFLFSFVIIRVLFYYYCGGGRQIIHLASSDQ